jgi:hypothetical protein
MANFTLLQQIALNLGTARYAQKQTDFEKQNKTKQKHTPRPYRQ